jgi:hypothetical protein
VRSTVFPKVLFAAGKIILMHVHMTIIPLDTYG